jgi:hypothetical protein
VSRDQNGNFSAGQITAANYVGSGFGLTDIPNSATTATPSFAFNAIVSRDQNGNFSGGQITALNFVGNGSGLVNIPATAVGATSSNTPSAVVQRDQNGNIFASGVLAYFFSGNGGGLTGIPNSATTATSNNSSNTIVARDASGNFSANFINATNISSDGIVSSGLIDFSSASLGTEPVRAVLSANTPATCAASRELLIKTDATPGQQLFICNAAGNGYLLIGDGVAANSSTVSGTSTGTLASVSQLGSGTGLDVSSTSGPALTAESGTGTAIHGDSGGVGVLGTTVSGAALYGAANNNNGSGAALVLTNSAGGTLIDGGVGTFPGMAAETFKVDASGDIFYGGALEAPYEVTGTWVGNALVKLTNTPGPLGTATVTMTSPTDKSGAIGIITGFFSGSKKLVAQGGVYPCNFDSAAQVGDYVGISQKAAGQCTDLGPNYPANGVQVVGRVVEATTPSFATILFFGPELHAVNTTNFSLTAADTSVFVGGTSTAATIQVANGGITSNKLAPNAVTSAQLAANAVTSANIADGALTPTKISGTAATLGANSFAGTQSIAGGLNVNGDVNITGPQNSTINLVNSNSSALLITESGGAGVMVRSNQDGIDTSSNSAFGLFASSAQGVGARGTGGKTGVEAQSPAIALSATALDVTGVGTPGVFTNLGPGKLLRGFLGSAEVFNVDTSGNLLSTGALYINYPDNGTILNGPVKLLPDGTAAATSVTDGPGGVIGIAIRSRDANGNAAIAYSGVASCVFDMANGFFPIPGNYFGISRAQPGQCADLGQNPSSGVQVLGKILLVPGATRSSFAPVLLVPTQGDNDPAISISTGAGLTGGPIGSMGTISIANSGVTNSMLQNSALTISLGSGLSGGGTVSLGGSITLNNTGALAFNGRSGNIMPALGDYSFAQLNGSASPFQLPSTTVYNNQSNTFSANQTVNAALIANSVAAGAIGGTSAVVEGSSNGSTSVVVIADGSAAGNAAALSASSQNNLAANFYSSGPNILAAGTATHNVLGVTSSGMTVTGNVAATAFSGDGSALSNVNASSVGGVAVTNLATTSALNTEATARQSADAGLQLNISAETASRQSDVANLQTSINNVSAADAKLASANTFTASNTFTAGTQDFSAAGATLPVRALPSAQTPVSCVAGKELLIKTDATAGQQLFICDANGTRWNLVGDGAAGGVTSFNGRNGSVSPSSGDYAFSQLSGTAAQSQLPANLVYNNQVNTFNASQTINGNLSATLFTGSGGGLSNVNAALLNNLPSSSFAQLSSNNTFNGSVTATSFNGDGSGLTNVNASMVTGLQMLKVTASITPSSVGVQSCSEQAFTVSGVNAGDTLLVVSQPSNHSPGANIAIGGWRVSANNTVNIQFCNVSRSASTPVAGTYTFALMR